MDRHAFFAAQAWLTATTTRARDGARASDDGDGDDGATREREEIYAGMCSFSCADEEQYETRAIATMDGDDAAAEGEDDAADDGEEDEEENGRGRRRARLRGALARDAQHLTFGTTATLSDPASVRVSFAAVKTTFGASSGTGSGSTSVGDATTANARARIELECELDGQTYRMSTRTCRAVVKSFKETARSGHTEAFPRYLSVIFPHVTMNVYSAAESDASWDGLRALARALTDPALATTKTTTTTSENYDDGHDTDPDGNDPSPAGVGKPNPLPRSIGNEIDLETVALADADAFAAQRFAADALCDAARLLVADGDPWRTLSHDLLAHGVRDVFADDPSAYAGRAFPGDK
jgi:hypothetical protein